MISDWSNKIRLRTWSLVLLTILALLLGPAMRQESLQYVDNWTKKSIVTFAAASGVSSVLSVIEDSEVQAGIGISASVALGDAVRPLNEMVARVASVALASAVSLGIQRVLIEVGAMAAFKWLMMFALVLVLITEWVGQPHLRRLANWLLSLALVAAFALPGAVLITGRVGEQFTQGTYAKAQHQLKGLKTEVKRVNPKRLAQLDASMKSTTAAFGEYAVNYIVVFILQTMLMPLLILWGLIKLLARLLNTQTTDGMEARLLSAIRQSAHLQHRSLSQPSEAATES